MEGFAGLHAVSPGITAVVAAGGVGGHFWSRCDLVSLWSPKEDFGQYQPLSAPPGPGHLGLLSYPHVAMLALH